MKLLQVCNVGEICGGTAACAWSITHALPEVEHAVIFLSPPNARTLQAFNHCQVDSMPIVDNGIVRKIKPSVVVLHNTARGRVSPVECAVTIQYHHSVGQRTPADLHVACSNWLASQIPQNPKVLYQPVPRPPKPLSSSVRSVSTALHIGRLCTPSQHKWPAELLDMYETLSERHPHVIWEFVGAPEHLTADLLRVCQARCRFHAPNVRARSLLWNWHAMLYHHPHLTESFGRVVAEAMRTGCVPMIDARGGFSEQVTSSDFGFLCDHVNSFSNAIEILTERGQWMRMSDVAKFYADEKFSLETFRSEFLKQLDQLC